MRAGSSLQVGSDVPADSDLSWLEPSQYGHACECVLRVELDSNERLGFSKYGKREGRSTRSESEVMKAYSGPQQPLISQHLSFGCESCVPKHQITIDSEERCREKANRQVSPIPGI